MMARPASSAASASSSVETIRPFIHDCREQRVLGADGHFGAGAMSINRLERNFETVAGQDGS